MHPGGVAAGPLGVKHTVAVGKESRQFRHPDPSHTEGSPRWLRRCRRQGNVGPGGLGRIRNGSSNASRREGACRVKRATAHSHWPWCKPIPPGESVLFASRSLLVAVINTVENNGSEHHKGAGKDPDEQDPPDGHELGSKDSHVHVEPPRGSEVTGDPRIRDARKPDGSEREVTPSPGETLHQSKGQIRAAAIRCYRSPRPVPVPSQRRPTGTVQTHSSCYVPRVSFARYVMGGIWDELGSGWNRHPGLTAHSNCTTLPSDESLGR